MNINDYVPKYNEITRILTERFAKSRRGENIVFSPMSVIMLLGIVADAVYGKTREEVKRLARRRC